MSLFEKKFTVSETMAYHGDDSCTDLWIPVDTIVVDGNPENDFDSFIFNRELQHMLFRQVHHTRCMFVGQPIHVYLNGKVWLCTIRDISSHKSTPESADIFSTIILHVNYLSPKPKEHSYA